jgi:hypothetical protein
MATESWLETDENKTLLAICTRKAIKGYGIGGIVWGLINVGIGVVAVQQNMINAGILVLAALMLASGIYCLTRPNVTAILIEAIVSCLLLAWNVGITVLNLSSGAPFDPRGIILPVVVAIVLFKEYGQLRVVGDLIAAVRPDQVKQAAQTCKAILKKKWKEDPTVALVQSGAFLGSGAGRMQRMEGKVFFVRGNLSRAFVMPDEALCASFSDPTVKKAKVVVQHPLGELTISLDRKNTDRVRSWLQPTVPAQPAAAASPS